jgi:hypothetical protein
MKPCSWASLGTCLSDFLREAEPEQKANISTLVDVSYATQGQNKNRDMCGVQCYKPIVKDLA